MLGFLLNVVHCWLSLSLKFVELVPSFVCGEGNSVGDSTCEVVMGNMTKPCT